MHYYQFNIGDYASHTRHLEPMEDLIYRRLLDLYYLHERPLSDDASVVAKQIGLRDEAARVRDVLNEFFDRTDEGYRSARADKEIENYRAMSEGGKRGAAKRWSKGGDSPPMATPEAPPIANINHKPITIKQETKKEKATVVAAPDGVSSITWESFLTLRKAKKAPVTPAAMGEIAKQAEKAGMTLESALSMCCARGWTGFNANWVAEKQTFAQQAADIARTTVPAVNKGPDPALVKIQQDREKAVPMPEHIRNQIRSVMRKV